MNAHSPQGKKTLPATSSKRKVNKIEKTEKAKNISNKMFENRSTKIGKSKAEDAGRGTREGAN
jgi:hypothetical protein